MGGEFSGDYRGAILTGPKICDIVTNKPALFSYAAVLAQSDDEETGNLVPSGKEVPPGVEVKTV